MITSVNGIIANRFCITSLSYASLIYTPIFQERLNGSIKISPCACVQVTTCEALSIQLISELANSQVYCELAILFDRLKLTKIKKEDFAAVTIQSCTGEQNKSAFTGVFWG